MPNVYVPVIVAGVFAAFFVAERFRPLRSRRAAIVPRLAINLTVSGLAFLTAMSAVRPSAVHALTWTSQESFGVVRLLPAPAWVRFVVGFVLLDLSFYYWHVLNHKLPVLWRFHNVHHIDPDLDVSTGFRFHFGEVLLSTLFRVTQVGAIGVSFAAFAAYELAFQANTVFHHSNVRLPIRWERVLNTVLVTPRMHGIHHSQIQRETHSNFGVVFPWWDALHRSLRLNVPQSGIEIGVAGYSRADDNGIWHALTLPFRKQRDYWRKPDGSLPQRDADVLQRKPTYLAE